MSSRLGEFLVREKIISLAQLDEALKQQKQTGARLGSVLVQMGFVTDQEVTNFLARQYGIPSIDLRQFAIDPAAVRLIPEDIARRYQILALSLVGASLTIAMADPTNIFALDDVKLITGFNVEPVVASESAITRAIEEVYGQPVTEEVGGEILYSPEDVNVEPGSLAEAVSAKRHDNAEYLVWYATTRRLNDPSDVSQGYSAERDDRVHYGSCRVFIPKSHKIGYIGSPWWKRLLTLTDDRLRLLEVRETSSQAHWQQIENHIRSVPLEDRHALVFIHGYNVSFEDAALRAAQIGFDLSIKGAMSFFSWPSRGRIDGYLADEATIEVNEDAISDYLMDFATDTGAQMVHVIAHSMGNRAVLRAVARIAQNAERRTGIRFGQFFLAAADIDVDKFRQLCKAYKDMAARTTLYVSKRDLAVEASRWLHQFSRVGLMPPVTIVDGLDTVNVTNSDLTLLGHGYVADARDVLADMHTLINYNPPPDHRFGLRPAISEDGKKYWLIGA